MKKLSIIGRLMAVAVGVFSSVEGKSIPESNARKQAIREFSRTRKLSPERSLDAHGSSINSGDRSNRRRATYYGAGRGSLPATANHMPMGAHVPQASSYHHAQATAGQRIPMNVEVPHATSSHGTKVHSSNPQKVYETHEQAAAAAASSSTEEVSTSEASSSTKEASPAEETASTKETETSTESSSPHQGIVIQESSIPFDPLTTQDKEASSTVTAEDAEAASGGVQAQDSDATTETAPAQDDTDSFSGVAQAQDTDSTTEAAQAQDTGSMPESSAETQDSGYTSSAAKDTAHGGKPRVTSIHGTRPEDAVSDPICGDGYLDTGEECDFGQDNGHGYCTSACLLDFAISICGNGIIEDYEECDNGASLNGLPDNHDYYADRNRDADQAELYANGQFSCADDEVLVFMSLETDPFGPTKSAVFLFDSYSKRDESVWAYNIGAFQGETTYEWITCLDSTACYEFYYIDSSMDGFSSGDGLYLEANGLTLLDIHPGDKGTYAMNEEFWGVRLGACTGSIGASLNGLPGSDCTENCYSPNHDYYADRNRDADQAELYVNGQFACADGEVLVFMSLETDPFGPTESAVFLFDSDSKREESVWAYNIGAFQGETTYEWIACLDSTAGYEFYYIDSFMDGFSSGDGLYLEANGLTLLDIHPGDKGTYAMYEEFWGVHLGACTGSIDTLAERIRPYSYASSAASATSDVQAASLVMQDTSGCSAETIDVRLDYQGDKNAAEHNELFLFDTDAPNYEFIWAYEVGAFRKDNYTWTTCVDPKRCNEFYFFDNGADGLASGGLDLEVDGVLAMSIGPGNEGTMFEGQQYWGVAFGVCNDNDSVSPGDLP